MDEKKKLDEALLNKISAGTAKEIQELKDAILANPKFTEEWNACARAAAYFGKPNDDLTIITYFLQDNIGFTQGRLSYTDPNTYELEDHQEILREIRRR